MNGRLILLAHAETDASRAATFPRDEPLNARGHEASRAMRPSLPRTDKAWRSPARAAGETAADLGLDAVIEPLLADLDCGSWRGHGLADVLASDPGATAWLHDPFYAGHGGTSIAAVQNRVGLWLAERMHDARPSLALTHAAVIRCAMLAVLGAPLSGFWHIDVPPLAWLDLNSDGRRWTIRQLCRAKA